MSAESSRQLNSNGQNNEAPDQRTAIVTEGMPVDDTNKILNPANGTHNDEDLDNIKTKSPLSSPMDPATLPSIVGGEEEDDEYNEDEDEGSGSGSGSGEDKVAGSNVSKNNSDIDTIGKVNCNRLGASDTSTYSNGNGHLATENNTQDNDDNKSRQQETLQKIVENPITIAQGPSVVQDIEAMDSPQLEKIQNKIVSDFRSLTQEYIMLRIQRADEYLKIIDGLKQDIQSQHFSFNQEVQKLEPQRDAIYSTEIPSAITESPVFKVPFLPKISPSSIFSQDFDTILEPFLQRLQIHYRNYKYCFQNTESQKYNNVKVVWQQYIQDRVSAKEDIKGQIEMEIEGLEKELYNLEPYNRKIDDINRLRASKIKVQPATVKKKVSKAAGNSGDDQEMPEEVLREQEKLQKCFEQAIDLKSAGVGSAKKRQNLVSASADEAFNDLYKINLFTEYKNETASKHHKFLSNVLQQFNDPTRGESLEKEKEEEPIGVRKGKFVKKEEGPSFHTSPLENTNLPLHQEKQIFALPASAPAPPQKRPVRLPGLSFLLSNDDDASLNSSPNHPGGRHIYDSDSVYSGRYGNEVRKRPFDAVADSVSSDTDYKRNRM